MLKEMLPMRPRIRKLKWGVSGLGSFSENSMLPALQRLRRARVNSVFSHNQGRAKSVAERFSIHGAFSDYQEFLKSDIDAVYIGSANVYHYEQVIHAAEAGKHILCDKPMAMNSAEARQMVETCARNNVFLAINFPFRFHPLLIKAKELIANQTIGKLISINAHFNIAFTAVDNFRYTRALSGGGALRDLGTHLVDNLRFLNGNLIPLHGCMDNIVFKGDVEDFASGAFRFENGGYGYINVSYSAPKGTNRIEIIGSRGCMTIDNMIGQRLGSSKLNIQIDGEARKAFRKRANKLSKLLKSVNMSFLKGESPVITGVDGLINMELIEAIENYAVKK